MHIYAFSDEAASRMEGQIAALKRNGLNVREAWRLPGRRVYYMHIKDALADGTVVPAGKGIGCLPELLKDFSARGGEAITLEPHLQVFEGLSDLEKDQTPFRALPIPPPTLLSTRRARR